jgi:hypothetical protein
MRVFHCDHCNRPVFFENTKCVACNHVLAYLPDLDEIGSLEPINDSEWTSPLQSQDRRYRLCRNYTESQVCNWTLTDSDGPQELCRACRLTRTIPDLAPQGHREAWYKLEAAKRRLLYTLFRFRLPVVEKSVDPIGGLAFEFLADPVDPAAPRVLTGHDNGLIRINIAEADDAQREQRRKHLHEPYRTLLGHFRHEIGHFYWDRLVKDSARLDGFRQLFGDERRDYADALQSHYEQGAPPDWQAHFVSAYSSAHPWEDWAETWAHYLHMADTLETAAACGLALRPTHRDEPALPKIAISESDGSTSFDRMVESWFAVTYVLNNLNRGMGLPDGYPFVLSSHVIEKLHFVHDVIAPHGVGAVGSSYFPAQT